MQLLLDRGADCNAQCGNNGTALQVAALSGNVGGVRLLLDRGAEVNSLSGEYGTALQAAAYRGHDYTPYPQRLFSALPSSLGCLA